MPKARETAPLELVPDNGGTLLTNAPSWTQASIRYILAALILMALSSGIFFLLLKNTIAGILSDRKKTTKEAMEADPRYFRSIQSDVIPRANMDHQPVDLIYKKDESASNIMNDIKTATKNDGVIRPVYINGKPVPREFVEEAMFQNQNFMWRSDQFPLTPNSQKIDHEMQNQKTMFGPPVVNMFGLDKITSRKDIQ